MTQELYGFWAVGKPGVEEIRKAIENSGFIINPKTPEIVISLGGDGSILRAAREFPNSSILPLTKESFGGLSELRHSQVDDTLGKIKKGEYKIEKVLKVEVQYKDFKAWGLNDVIVYRDDEQCNRMRVFYDGKDIYEKELIGDGIIASSASGTAGYCHSADGEVLLQTERSFEIVPMYSQYKGNETIKGRRVLTNIREAKVFPEGKEVFVVYNRKIRNKIVPDAIQSQRRYFDFDVGDEVIVRAARENGRFVKIL